MSDEPTCGHCRAPMRGYASAGDTWLCHPDEGLDCYRMVTVYKHTMPCFQCASIHYDESPRRVRTQVERDADGTTWRHHAPGGGLCTSSQPWICTPADCPGCFNPHCWVVDRRTCRSGCDVVPHDQLTPDQLAAIKEQMAADMRGARERFLAAMATGSQRALVEPDPDIWVSRERQGPRPSPPLVAPIHPEEPVTDEKRVVLIKPGDVLLIGGVRFGSAEQGSEAMLRFKELTGITPVVFFAGDIQLDALTAEQLAELIREPA